MTGEQFVILNNYIANAEYGNVLLYFFNNFLPYGMLFWLIGFAVFLIVHMKTKNFAFSGAVASLYFLVLSSTGFVTVAVVKYAMQWFGTIVGILTGYYIYKMIKE